MRNIDNDGCIRLLGAIVRQWIADARRNTDELQELAAFLELADPDHVLRISPRNFMSLQR